MGLLDYIKTKNKERKITNHKQSMLPRYDDISILEKEKGELEEFENSIYCSESKIGIIIGRRRSGKTGLGMRFLENVHSKNNRKCVCMGFQYEDLPSWVELVEDINEIENGSFVLIDESGIKFSSRNSMSNGNKLLSSLIKIGIHSILY